MIRAFAAMFLNEPHRTTRNFAGIKAKVGKDIFAKDQRMELYYTAAYALYKSRFAIRTGRIRREFSPAIFHIILVLRILIAGYDRPAFADSGDVDGQFRRDVNTVGAKQRWYLHDA